MKQYKNVLSFILNVVIKENKYNYVIKYLISHNQLKAYKFLKEKKSKFMIYPNFKVRQLYFQKVWIV